MFDQEDCIGRALRLNYTCCLGRCKRCPLAEEPPGTQSIMLQFYDENQRYAFMVHCYPRPDGTIGGSGKLDPTSIVGLDGIEYILPRSGFDGGGHHLI